MRTLKVLKLFTQIWEREGGKEVQRHNMKCTIKLKVLFEEGEWYKNCENHKKLKLSTDFLRENF